MKNKKYLIWVFGIIGFAAVSAVTVRAVSPSEQMQISAFGVSTLKGLEGVNTMVTIAFRRGTGEPRELNLLSEEKIKSELEQMLSEAGIKIAGQNTKNIGLLAIGIVGIMPDRGRASYLLTVQAELIQHVKLIRDEKIVTAARTWPGWTGTQLISVGPSQMKIAVSKAITSQVKTFIDDYIAANPQVKKPAIP